MQKTMKAAIIEKFGEPLTIRELPIPTPGPGQVLMQVISSGVCHTDLHAADGDWPVKPTLPFIPGHEGAGFVVPSENPISVKKDEVQELWRASQSVGRSIIASPAAKNRRAVTFSGSQTGKNAQRRSRRRAY